jgi:hypothetical protein
VCAGRGSGPDQRGAQVRGRHQEDQYCRRPQAGRRQPQAKDGHILAVLCVAGSWQEVLAQSTTKKYRDRNLYSRDVIAQKCRNHFHSGDENCFKRAGLSLSEISSLGRM